MPLRGGLLEPARGIDQPLRDTVATGIQRADRELRLGLAGFRGRPIPQRRLGIALRGALPEAVHLREVQHRRRVPLPGRLPEIGFRHDQVLRHAVAAQQMQRQIVAGAPVAVFGGLTKQHDGAFRIAFHPGA